ncbi:hypothetical protein [Aquabacterium sp.]|uniref:hypothetical protein n=1 Tax=Aquabacterium sp. TaxID=1872578 RepID=UPI002C2B18CB|nr:hypothetical protein [Aquabacterium sp.]HSW02931.1 hypothetical protein [Aquabacterium sp.]
MATGDHRGVGLLRRALAAMGIGVGLCVGAAGASPDSREEVLQAGDYLLRTRILHAGTRSEGRVGRLFHNGIEVPGRTPGESIDVPRPAGTVRFTYMGEARARLWSISGWTDRAVPR